jgi:polar amino acid transport system substrate-binding protein
MDIRVISPMVYKAVEFRKSPPAMQSKIPFSLDIGSLQTARAILAAAALSLGVLVALPGATQAQNIAKPGVQAAPQAVPGFWDPRRRPDRPDLSRLTVIRFLTETDYPPFNFTGADGNPAGFNVDLARLLCEEIKATCTVQMRRFETLLDAIASNRGDAIIASLAVTPQLRARLDFTDPYYRAPARFVSRRDAVMPEVRPEYLEGKKIGAIAGSAADEYLRTVGAEVVPFQTDAEEFSAVSTGRVSAILEDDTKVALFLKANKDAPMEMVTGIAVPDELIFKYGYGYVRIGLRKEDCSLRAAYTQGLAEIRGNGQVSAMLKKYGFSNRNLFFFPM